ncbi:MAG: hypothetical protein JG774_679 [Desulfomicrobiaceae bacterium]|jgi:hypothetical protein|nr:hypothetical protein [Desulfomicrobiaceae bacterium]MDK2872608.1 hypothetical protein [Desulfomicrobiaceae bacterium]
MQRPFLGATDVVYRLLSTRKRGAHGCADAGHGRR